MHLLLNFLLILMQNFVKLVIEEVLFVENPVRRNFLIIKIRQYKSSCGLRALPEILVVDQLLEVMDLSLMY